MKRIDFTKLEIMCSFEDEASGRTTEVSIAKPLANLMKYSGPTLMDIGFEELARIIYFSEGPVDVADNYAAAIKGLLAYSNLSAAVKRALISKL